MTDRNGVTLKVGDYVKMHRPRVVGYKTFDFGIIGEIDKYQTQLGDILVISDLNGQPVTLSASPSMLAVDIPKPMQKRRLDIAYDIFKQMFIDARSMI